MAIARMVMVSFPAVKKQLGEYREFLQAVDSPLSQQGIDSIRDKEFHCLGGSVYSLLAEKRLRRAVLQFIVAFQTISDYLDNLCDRFGIYSEKVFRRLHTAMLDSLEPIATDYQDYYSLFPVYEDGGYLPRLVKDCRDALKRIPAYPSCQEQVEKLTRLYIDLQSFKHLERREGEEKLASLYMRCEKEAPGLYWWEFAAACGSTLGIFTLVAAGREPNAYWEAYMPWVCGLHILLDYFIDQAEDVQHEDMNLVSYYQESDLHIQRMLWFYRRAKIAISRLNEASFHALVVDGLLALYLSDPKARSSELKEPTAKILAGADLRARMLERLAFALRLCRVV